MAHSFYVKAIWDPEAEVWCSESNILGLVLETATLGEFESLARHFAPELLAENLGIHGEVPVRFEAVGGFDVVAA
ncbi:MAG: hypothetical protein DI552_08725 [Brevundimonas sp.]|jgi:hypothetical protein|uniref:DUF1902 domain-containing protein n=1 Tax=Brevundimonas albigilva TaxID=1312364 RepID=A0ABY4SM92_9CAUL|nr:MULTISPECIES: DUF1902 domain-containing protein [Brevundimonas]MBD3837433.1 DUF1902 domain-containing protein [Brevundimonas sp.]PZU56947.1 MAG: hypothetical protein DI552_08725 [Brevundimonas sp.]UQV18032.1 DUF1902 domain-containing protein [Brevundimonas albigilva]URI13983.1 DUF1902 domain-containing protein [Brevundimonas albigilva]